MAIVVFMISSIGAIGVALTSWAFLGLGAVAALCVYIIGSVALGLVLIAISEFYKVQPYAGVAMSSEKANRN